LVELGDRQWQEGDKVKAQETWPRIKYIVHDKARANEVLGEVYLEHDMPQQALEALREAMKLQPKALKYKKAYALALERTGASASGIDSRNRQYDEARRIWEQILKRRAPATSTSRAKRGNTLSPSGACRVSSSSARFRSIAGSRAILPISTPVACSPRCRSGSGATPTRSGRSSSSWPRRRATPEA
jgi:tetratricopeptide (TPR) repeat protein